MGAINMTSIESLINGIIAVEGGYVDHPHDRGGPTNHGITERVAREYGFTGDMRYLPKEIAYEIYLNRYYIKPGFDKVATSSGRVSRELTDTGVNMGVHTSGVFFQRALNAFNRDREDYEDLLVDGQVGPATIGAFSQFLKKRAGQQGEIVMLRALNALQGARYIEIAERDPTQEAFTFGWFSHRITI